MYYQGGRASKERREGSCIETYCLDQPTGESALLILLATTYRPIPPQAKIAVSSRYKPGFLRRYSHNTSSMIGAISPARPTRVGGALGGPKTRRLEPVYLTVCLLYSATLAVFDIEMLQLSHGCPHRYCRFVNEAL